MSKATYGPRSKANARLLLDAASALGYPSRVVKTWRGGYTVPQDVLDAALGVEEIEEGVEYPVPEIGAPEGVPESEDVPEPPRGGPAASRDVWIEYATYLGIEVADDDTRNEIIEKVDAQKEGN